MLFNTVEYLLFFIGVLTIAWVTAGHRRFRNDFDLLSCQLLLLFQQQWLANFTTTVHRNGGLGSVPTPGE